MADETPTAILEMTARPGLLVKWPHRGGMLLRLEEASVEFYRFLLVSIGVSQGTDRLALSDEALFAMLEDPLLEVFVLFLGAAPAGVFELDRREPGAVELAHFGLLPGFGGRGLAKYLLVKAVEAAWDEDPDRVWVSTAGSDDAGSLLLYQWAGFTRMPGDG